MTGQNFELQVRRMRDEALQNNNECNHSDFIKRDNFRQRARNTFQSPPIYYSGGVCRTEFNRIARFSA